jgi:hypothetical protein
VKRFMVLSPLRKLLLVVALGVLFWLVLLGLSALFASGNAAHAADTPRTTWKEYRHYKALEKKVTTSTQSISVKPAVAGDAKAAKVKCWYAGGRVGMEWNFNEAGVKIADIVEEHYGWCGNGQHITYGINNYADALWSQFPWCIGNPFGKEGGDGPGWWHGGEWGSLGLWTPWGTCGTYLSGHATERIAAGGANDNYDDWGF